MPTYFVDSGTTSFTVPSGERMLNMYCWGAGGTGPSPALGAGGSGGGASARTGSTAGPLTQFFTGVGTVGSGDGGDTTIWADAGHTTVLCLARGGKAPTGSTGGPGGSAATSTGDSTFSGGSGANGNGAGTGGGGGSAADAIVASNGNNGAGTTGGASVGGQSGAGGNAGANNGSNYGGGGGGGFSNGSSGSGAVGRIAFVTTFIDAVLATPSLYRDDCDRGPVPPIRTIPTI